MAPLALIVPEDVMLPPKLWPPKPSPLALILPVVRILPEDDMLLIPRMSPLALIFPSTTNDPVGVEFPIPMAPLEEIYKEGDGVSVGLTLDLNSIFPSSPAFPCAVIFKSLPYWCISLESKAKCLSELDKINAAKAEWERWLILDAISLALYICKPDSDKLVSVVPTITGVKK